MEVRDSRILRMIPLALVVAVLCPFAWGRVIYVDDDADGANDGTSWDDAYVALQDALADASDSDKPVEIRVAQGLYRPDQGANQTAGDREATFHLIDAVALKGAYAGAGAAEPNARDVTRFESILSGDLRANDPPLAEPYDPGFQPSRLDNSLHVVTGSGTNRHASIDGFTITGGDACAPASNGGGMLNEAGSPSVTHCTFIDNRAVNNGGAVCNSESSQAFFEACTFTTNGAGLGGAMYNVDSAPVVVACAFLNNRGAWSGGAVWSVGGEPKLRDCTICGNQAVGAGGGVCSRDNVIELTNCTITDNAITTGTLSGGGGVAGVSSDLTLIGCTIARNATYETSQSGGGIDCHRGSIVVRHCRIETNRSYRGGGLYCWRADATIADSTFTGNIAPRYGSASDPTGGGLHVYHCNAVSVERCTFVGNAAFYAGGAVYCDDSNLRLAGCRLAGNGSYFDSPLIFGRGGALSARNSDEVVVSDCEIVGNLAPSIGGAVHLRAAKLTLLGCTVAGNRANKGGALWCDLRAEVTMRNTIVWDNADDQNPQIWAEESTLALAYCDVQRGLGTIGQREPGDNAISWGSGNIISDPRFAGPGHWDAGGTPQDPRDDFRVAGDYRLRPDSPCIDAGDPSYGTDPAATAIDVHNGPRLIRGRVDIGADEHVPCELVDLDNDGIVAFEDYAILAGHWRRTGCVAVGGDSCHGSDIDASGSVDLIDLLGLCEHWAVGLRK